MRKYFLLFFILVGFFSISLSADPLFKTAFQLIEFQDMSRENRPIPVQIFYPTDIETKTEPVTKGISIRKEIAYNGSISTKNKNYPLILYSHGHGGTKTDIAWLADILVPKGYIIAALDHVGNTEIDQKPNYLLGHFDDRVKDMSFALSKLLEHSDWGSKIDPTKIAALGFSKGGTTTTFLAGGQMDGPRLKNYVETYFYNAQETAPYALKLIEKIDWSLVEKNYKDARIKAFITFAPAFGNHFTEKSLSTITSPFLIIVGENDLLMPPAQNAAFLKQHIKSAQYHLLPGKTGHFVFMNQCNQPGFIFAEGICRDDPSVNRGDLHEKIANIVDLFLNKSF